MLLFWRSYALVDSGSGIGGFGAQVKRGFPKYRSDDLLNRKEQGPRMLESRWARLPSCGSTQRLENGNCCGGLDPACRRLPVSRAD